MYKEGFKPLVFSYMDYQKNKIGWSRSKIENVTYE
jgi:hypothetical protein